jgi:hypothetical protein
MKKLSALLSLSSRPLDIPVEMGHIYSKKDIAETEEKVKTLKNRLKEYEKITSMVKDVVEDLPLLSSSERRKYKEAKKMTSRTNAGLGPLEARLRWMKTSHEFDYPQPDKHLILKYSIERDIMPGKAAEELDTQLDTVFFPPYIEDRAKYMLWKYRTFTYAGEPTWEQGDYKHRRKWLMKAAEAEDEQWGIGKTPMQDLANTNIKNWEKLRDFVKGIGDPYIQDTISSSVGRGTSRFSAAQLAQVHASAPVSKDIITNVPLSNFSGMIASKNQEDAIERMKYEESVDEFGFIFTALAIAGTFITTTLPAFVVSFLGAPFAFLVANVPALGPVLSLVPEGLMPLLTQLGEAEAKKVVAKIAPAGVRKAVNVLAPETASSTPSIQSALPVSLPSLPSVPEVIKTVAKAPVTVVKAVGSGAGAVVKTVTSGVSISPPSLPKVSTSGISISAPKDIKTPTLASSTLSKSSLGRKVLSKANEAIEKEVSVLNTKKDQLVSSVRDFDMEAELKKKAEEELMKALMPKAPSFPAIENGQLVAVDEGTIDRYQKAADANKPKEKGMTNALLIGAAAVGAAVVMS